MFAVKKLKKIPLMLLLIVMISSLGGCSKTVSEKPKEQIKKEDIKETEVTTKPTSGSISDDLYRYEILLNGVAYSLPTSFSTFEKNGWVGKDFGSDKLDPNQYTIRTLQNGEQTIIVKMANLDINVSPIPKCYVAGVTVEPDSKNQGPTVSIAKGITIASTYDEVIAAYGKPSNEYKGGTINKLTYKSGSYSSYDISLDTKTNKVYSIEVQNIIPPTKTQTKPVSTELPTVVKNYKAPSSIGKDLFSFQVKYGGNYYKLPAPITEFEKNGWVLQSNPDEVIPAKSGVVGVELRKSNQVLRTQIENYSDKAEPLKHSFVTYIEYYNNGAQIPLELPKGISEKSSIDEVIAAYGQPTKIDESASFKYYIYGKVFSEVVFVTNKGKIEKIEVNYSPKNLD